MRLIIFETAFNSTITCFVIMITYYLDAALNSNNFSSTNIQVVFILGNVVIIMMSVMKIFYYILVLTNENIRYNHVTGFMLPFILGGLCGLAPRIDLSYCGKNLALITTIRSFYIITAIVFIAHFIFWNIIRTNQLSTVGERKGKGDL